MCIFFFHELDIYCLHEKISSDSLIIGALKITRDDDKKKGRKEEKKGI